MSLSERRVVDSERDSLNVKSVQGSRLTGTVQENKHIFDRLVECLLDRYNDLIDDLTSSAAAGEIGADIADVTEKTVQGVLNKHDGDIKNRYTKAETDALLGEDTKNLIESFDIDLSTGVITVTRKDGAAQSWDTALEKIPASFEFVQEDEKYYLKVTNEDGTSTKTDVTALMNHYLFNNSGEVAFTVTGDGPEKTVTASIRANSLGIDKLSLSVVSQLEGYVSSAAQSAAAAGLSKEAAQTAQTTAIEAAATATAASGQSGQSAAAARASERSSRSFAKGDTNTREGEETDNAKYYCGLANNEADRALSEADRAKAEADRATVIAGGDFATKEDAQEYVDAHNTANHAHEQLFAAKADDAELKALEATVTEGLQSAIQNTQTQITAHNASTTAHPDIRADQDQLADRVNQLEDMIANDVAADPFEMDFETLDGLIVTGVWNKARKRIEF